MSVLTDRVVLGTGSWGRVVSRRRLELMREAWAIGIRSIDTAPSYGFGGVEADVLRWWPGAIDTKVGLQPSKSQRRLSAVYPLLWRAASIRQPRNSAASVAVAPRSDLEPSTLEQAAIRVGSTADSRLRTLWIHDAPSTDVGLQARGTLAALLALDEGRCGLAWTLTPPEVPSDSPLLLPYCGSDGERPAPFVHWHGVVRFFAERADPTNSERLAEYLAGVLWQLAPRDRMLIGAYRQTHLDVLHRVAALHRACEADPDLAARLASAVADIEQAA